MKSRIIGFDLARCLAILGMVIVNFKIVMGAEKRGPAWLVDLVGRLDGRAAALFVILAGIGISLFSQRGRESGVPEHIQHDRRTLCKRALFLFVIGLGYAPLWPADILHFYGVYLACAALLLTASVWHLWSVIAAFVVGFPTLLFMFDYERGWNWATLEYSDFWTPAGMLRHLFFNGFHPVIPWLAFLVLGMLLGRLDFRNSRVRQRVALWGALAAIGSETVSWFIIRWLSNGRLPQNQELITAIFGTKPMPPMPLYLIAASGTACVLIAACVALGERFNHAGWLKPFVATGQLALTLYVAHVVVGMGVLAAIGRLEEQSLVFALAASLIFFGSSVVAAYLWRRTFARGPLEMLMRRLTNAPRPATSQHRAHQRR